MAPCWTMWVSVVVSISTGLAMPDPSRAGSDQLSEEFLARYLDRQQSAQNPQVPQQVPGWPYTDVEFGQVAGVDVTPTYDVIVFHRGNRSWTEETFDAETNMLPESQRVSIPQDTIVRLDGNTGQVLSSFGANSFYVPHGLTVDREGNLWLTDVGTHQVYRIPKGQTEPDLTLGEKFVTKKDDKHFCKPTDVAVASNGDFFVSDGYCNARVLKFSATGQLLGKFGTNTLNADPEFPTSFNVPHSLALIEELDIVCVADRENQRALCFNAGLGSSKLGHFNRTIVPGGEIGRVYGLAYDPNSRVIHAAAVLSQQPVYDKQGYPYSPPRAFTYDIEGRFLGDWDYITPREAEQGPSIRHDIAVSPDGSDVYLADVLERVVRKFSIHPFANKKFFG
ncbi:putative peptidyl-alpha-hydroxyglycine alpha-amidating lyase pgal-1 [Babylonia areolata]|uniref:putative peptidyl-alpha-hydroxyglycine alpha-amidating lyase pgal-1 n=1 Tax=Babylonia areolata TaxID=304850 RepID=UPI003FD1AFCF